MQRTPIKGVHIFRVYCCFVSWATGPVPVIRRGEKHFSLAERAVKSQLPLEGDLVGSRPERFSAISRRRLRCLPPLPSSRVDLGVLISSDGSTIGGRP